MTTCSTTSRDVRRDKDSLAHVETASAPRSIAILKGPGEACRAAAIVSGAPSMPVTAGAGQGKRLGEESGTPAGHRPARAGESAFRLVRPAPNAGRSVPPNRSSQPRIEPVTSIRRSCLRIPPNPCEAPENGRASFGIDAGCG